MTDDSERVETIDLGPGAGIAVNRTLADPDPQAIADGLADTDAVVREAAKAHAAGRKPLLGPGAPIFDKPRRFLLNRYEDPNGTTGVGAVAWGCLWPSGRVSLDWQTTPAMQGGYYESMEAVLALHGHETGVEWLDLA